MSTDQPDWNAGGGTAVTNIVKGHVLSGGGIASSDQAGASGVVVVITGRTINTGLLIDFVWFADLDTADYTCQVFTSSMPTVDDLTVLTMEMPAYGGTLQVTNYGPETIDFIVTSTNRAVEVPRLLSNVGPGFTYTAEDDLVADTPLQLLTASVEGSTYFSNGSTGFIVASDTDGILAVAYIGPDNIHYTLPLAAITAGTPVYFTAALPQAGVWFTFTSPTDVAGPNITVLACPTYP